MVGQMSKLEFRSRVNRAAKSDSGHLPPLTAGTPHSRTITVRIAAQRNRRNTPATGKARMLVARNAQTAVTRCEDTTPCMIAVGFNQVAGERLSTDLNWRRSDVAAERIALGQTTT